MIIIVDTTPKANYQPDNDRLFVKFGSVPAVGPTQGKITCRLTVSEGDSSSVDALETAGNYNVTDATGIYVGSSIAGDGNTWNDVSGNARHITNVGATKTADKFGISDYAWAIDDTSRLEIADMGVSNHDESTIIYDAQGTSGIMSTFSGSSTNQILSENSIRYTVEGSVNSRRFEYSADISEWLNYAFVDSSYDSYTIPDNSTFQIYVDNTLITPSLSTVSPISDERFPFQIGGSNASLIGILNIMRLAVFSRKLLDEERTAIAEFRKYAPNLDVSELSPVEGQTNVYEFTVQNTGETDYTDVQAVVDISGLGLTGNAYFEIVEFKNEAPDIIEFPLPYITSDTTHDLTVKVSDETAIKSVIIDVNGTAYEMSELYSNTYFKSLPLIPGENVVKLTVTDYANLETTQTKTIVSVNSTNEILKYLTHNYDKSSTSNIFKIANAFANQDYELMDVFQQINVSNDIDTATGYMLDRIGQDINQPRGASIDSQYRVLLKLRMSRYLSSGTYDDIVNILASSFNTTVDKIVLEPNPEGEAATVKITITPAVLGIAGISASQAYSIMTSIVGAGIKVAALLDGTIELSNAYGITSTTKGLSDELGTTGGTLSGYIDDDTVLPIV